jgi:hypothetical protein
MKVSINWASVIVTALAAFLIVILAPFVGINLGVSQKAAGA